MGTIPAEVAYSDAQFSCYLLVDGEFHRALACEALRKRPVRTLASQATLLPGGDWKHFTTPAGDFSLTMSLVGPDTLDADGSWSADVSGWVAMACGTNLGYNFNPQELERFWEWWLLEAIPAAYNEPITASAWGFAAFRV